MDELTLRTQAPPASGTRSVTQTPADPTPAADDKIKYTSFGLNVGLLGYF